MSKTKKYNVIICRPSDKGKVLIKQLLSSGINAELLPTFDIILDEPCIKTNMGSFSDIIFTSSYAVDSFFQSYYNKYDMTTLRTWAIGKATKIKLKEYNIDSISPRQESSQGLYRLILNKKLSQVYGFLIFKGKKGYDFLEKNLSKIYKVKIIECYRRIPKNHEYLIERVKLFKKIFGNPNLFVFTSFDGLRFAMPIFSYHSSWLVRSSITVTNTRMFSWAKEQGFSNIYFLDNMSNTTLFNFIYKLIK